MWLFNDFAKRWDFSRIKQNSLTFPWLFPGDCGNAERIDVSSKSIMQKINNIIYPLHDAFGTYHPVLQTCFRVFHCTLRSPRSCFYISTPLQSMRHSTIPHYDLISIKPFQYTKLKQVEGTQLTRSTNCEYSFLLSLSKNTGEIWETAVFASLPCRGSEVFLWAKLFEGWLALNPGSNLTQVSFSCVQKHFLG